MQVVGAVYLDGGLDRVRDVYTRCFPLPSSIKDVLLHKDKSQYYPNADGE